LLKSVLRKRKRSGQQGTPMGPSRLSQVRCTECQSRSRRKNRVPRPTVVEIRVVEKRRQRDLPQNRLEIAKKTSQNNQQHRAGTQDKDHENKHPPRCRFVGCPWRTPVKPFWGCSVRMSSEIRCREGIRLRSLDRLRGVGWGKSAWKIALPVINRTTPAGQAQLFVTRT